MYSGENIGIAAQVDRQVVISVPLLCSISVRIIQFVISLAGGFFMIQINALEKYYGLQPVLKQAGFVLNPGERVGLVGRNGSGKTTLFRMILGQEHQDSGTITIPDYYKIGHLSQHINFTHDSVIKEACSSLPDNDDGIDESFKAETVLMGLGFSKEEFDTDPRMLSGGYQVRLNLAKVLVSGPNLLLLDEPTNYLDILSLRWLSGFLRNWQNELLIITHDKSFMDSVTTHTMALHRCSLKKIAGSTDNVYARLLEEEELYERTRINDDKKRMETEQFINRFRAKASKAKAVQSRVKALQKHEVQEKLSSIQNLDFAFNEARFTGRHLIEARDLSFGYSAEGPRLIEGLSFFIGKSDRITIIKKNGRGKTTLLNLLAGELKPDAGSVVRHDSLQVAYFGQTNINRLNHENTVEQEIMNSHPDHSRGKARSICGAMMFSGDTALKKVSVLSGGEKSRVLLGKLLVSPTNMLMLDEPTNHLDMESTESLVEAVDAFGGAVILVTHSEMILHSLATRLIVFDRGRVTLFEGTYQDFLDRVGWADEEESLPGGFSAVKEPQYSKKEMRRLRAELVNEKSRMLGKLQKKIDQVENDIIALEAGIEKSNEELMAASVAGNGDRIGELSKLLHESQTAVDALFQELEVLHTDFDTRSEDFEKRLENLQAEIV